MAVLYIIVIITFGTFDVIFISSQYMIKKICIADANRGYNACVLMQVVERSGRGVARMPLSIINYYWKGY